MAKAKKATKKKAAKKKAAKKKAAKPVKTSPRADLSSVLTPLDDRVLIRMTGAERKTAGGLYIPDTVSDLSGNLQGQVVAVGRGHRDVKGRMRLLDVQIGDQVIFPEHSGSKIRVLNEDLVILREGEIMGVLS